ncbi:hypothetical protein [Burkholderia cenocepacia]|uniref:hypothetical protein n=1 Tax=Burkholderia cenocepacia TaxID=95486 RepID=UPI00158CAE8F|nr:hypothetical protein [Burkholderia cenocepacia]
MAHVSVDIINSFDKKRSANSTRRINMATRKRMPKKQVGVGVEGKPKVRIGARVEQDLYMLCKMAYLRQGWSLESRVEELLKRDIDSMSKNQWFKEMMSSELLTKYVAQAKDGQANTDSSDFDTNNVGGNDDGE